MKPALPAGIIMIFPNPPSEKMLNLLSKACAKPADEHLSYILTKPTFEDRDCLSCVLEAISEHVKLIPFND